VPEVPLDIARTWVEFADPDNSGQRFRCDLTWLTSSWMCIFGSGCQGIDAGRPDDGCCTLGAHFTEQADYRNVRRVARLLGPLEWQFRPSDGAGHKDSWTELEDGVRKTRVVEGACIFLNRPGFAAGAGCALHLRAVRDATQPLEYKPEVCWQLPIRRSYRTVERPDGTEYLEVTITEYDRRSWGAGGHDLHWFCSGNSEAHVGREPVYRSCRDELVALMGATAYAELELHCAAHLRAVRTVRRENGQALLPLLVHPATLAAQQPSPAASPAPSGQRPSPTPSGQ
jgi:hypothetical protein